MVYSPRLIIVVGNPGSGKDILVRAVYDLGTQHANVVPKHTSRNRIKDDGKEMICSDDPNFALEKCDVVYENYGDRYGIETVKIWKGLKRGIFQVLVVSNVDAINKLRTIFGGLIILVYVHSEIQPDEYQNTESKHGYEQEYIKRRVTEYNKAFRSYLRNFLAFKHVFIYTDSDEDLYDQIFRLFRSYEKREL